MKTDGPAPSPSPDVAALAFAARVEQLYRLNPRTLATAVVFSVATFFLYLGATPLRVLLGWLVVNNLVSVARYALVRAYRRASPTPDEAPLWHRRFVVGTFVAGVIWGMLGSVLLPPGDTEYHAIATAALVGTTGVGLYTLAASRVAYLSLTVPTLLQGAVVIPLGGEWVSLMLGGGLGIFILIAIVNSSMVEGVQDEMLRLRFENSRIAAEREAALVAAQAAAEARMRFLANMSHEIRTPLNGILGMGRLLATGHLDAAQRRRVDTVIASGDHLLALVNGVLDFSKISAGKLEIERRPFALREAVGGAVSLLAARADERDIGLRIRVADSVPRWVEGDAARLSQVLINLVGNAVKFTENGHVAVNVRGVPGRDGAPTSRLLFEVIDTGVGIAPADRERIFEAFQQGDDRTTRRHGGTGLGLAISKEIVQLMGGEIGCESTPGQGSRFWFRVELPAVEAPPERAGKPANGVTAHLLLVEDNPINREIAKEALEFSGFVVACAEDGEQAVALSAEMAFDAILMDCQLPVLDGYGATQRIREREAAAGAKRVPIIALTANVMAEDRERCLAAGMDDYLPKPFDFDDLVACVGRWVGEAKAGQAPAST